MKRALVPKKGSEYNFQDFSHVAIFAGQWLQNDRLKLKAVCFPTERVGLQKLFCHRGCNLCGFIEE
jgi:hypothetical protein